MPLAAVTSDNRVHLVEKDHTQGATYKSTKREITLRHTPQEVRYTSHADLKSLLNFSTQTESEKKEGLTHTICSSYNFSKRKASKLYGISNPKKWSDKVSAASNKAKKSRTEARPQQKKKAYLASRGVDRKHILPVSSKSDGSDSYNATEVSLESLVSESEEEVNNNELEQVQENSH